MRRISVFAGLFVTLFATVLYAKVTAEQFSSQSHPRIFATVQDRDALLEKTKQNKWAADIYDDIKSKVDPIVDRHVTDPEFAISRMQMHWEEGKRYVNFYTEGNFVPKRQGNCEYPTVRLLYGRAAPGTPPVPPLEKLAPYGNGDIPMLKDGKWITVPFEKTQLGSEDINKWFINRAYDASIVYYFTGEKKYAKFAADVLWTFIRGASYHNPVNPETEGGPYGYLSWETLGDTRRFTTLPLAYDFIYDYLMDEYFDSDEFKNGRDGEIWAPPHPQGKAWALDRIHIMFEKFIDNKLQRGGGLMKNWNTNEHESAMLYALALDNNQAYSDGKGREYYVEKMLYGPTTKTHGAYVDVAKANLNPDTGLWPEPPAGYGQNSIQQLIRFGFWYYKNGIDVLATEPLLKKAAVSFLQMSFPNGYATCWGDTNYLPVFKEQAELMIAYARAKGDIELEDNVTALLNFAGGRDYKGMYRLPLFFYVPELRKVTKKLEYPRVSYSPDHSIIFERNLADDPKDALAYTVSGYGSKSGHLQANGITMEIYGRGHVLGVDPGWGPDYWVPQHTRYNRRIASHNTVVPNGISCERKFPLDLKIEFAEPKVEPGVDPKVQISPLCQFTDTSGTYRAKDFSADQRRLMGIVRSSKTEGYYIDIFRSKVPAGDKYHDYLFHNMGTGLAVLNFAGEGLPLTDTPLDANSGFGYEFFRDDRSYEYSGDVRAVFNFGSDDIHTNMWLLGGEGRTVYSLSSPNNHRYYLDRLKQTPVPVFMARQTGQAWTRPFIAVYEPYGNGLKPFIKNVRRMKDAPQQGDFVGLAVEHNSQSRIEYILNATDVGKEYNYEGVGFKGIYGVAAKDQTSLKYLYLGTGSRLSIGNCGIKANDNKLIKACLTYEKPADDSAGDTGYSYSSDSALTIKIPYAGEDFKDISVYYETSAGFVPAIETTANEKDRVLIAKLPAAMDAKLHVKVKGNKEL